MALEWDLMTVSQLVALGLVAGTLGGLLGVGGSVVMIPGLTIILGRHQHTYQAAAMITNVAVSVPAALRHHTAGALRLSRLRWMMPTALLGVTLGVWLSNLPWFQGRDGGVWLGRLLAAFLAYVILVNLRKLMGPKIRDDDHQPPAVVKPWRDAGVGSVTGVVAGLLGIGGGAVAVPLQHAWLGLPLRTCIANSSTLICITAAAGALYKNATLYTHDQPWQQSVAVALMLAPSCWLGGTSGGD